MTDPSATLRDRSRLIDHFKRAYTIIAGLAITEACKTMWPFSWASLVNYPFWMFATFFITIVPIFHGGDRSLDAKYLTDETKSTEQRFSYIWDVYMLLISAILFVGIAEAIPKQSMNGKSDPADPAQFYFFMSFLFFFDSLVLVVDFFKSDRGRKEIIKNPYKRWIPVNFCMSVFCFVFAYAIAQDGAISVFPISIIVFAAAAARTLYDYWRSDEFMFP